MRLFIAAPVGAEIRRAAAGLLERLRSAGADYKWADPENLHLTLSFHGSAALEQIPALKEAMAQAAAGRQAFSLSLEGLGAFGSMDDPRVLWVGLGRGLEILRDIAAALRAALEGAGLLGEEEKKREFRGHLTLGRRRSRRNQEKLKELLKNTPSELGAELIDRIVLYESRLSSAGPRHAVLFEARLGYAITRTHS